MKESTIEQKAKAYDQALDKMKMLLGTCSSCSREELEYVFPELKESEGEQIRKELLAWLKSSDGQTLPIDRYNAAIAWLEKQGEQNPTNKVEHKFKVGDKVKKGYLTYTVEDIDEDSYKLQAYSKDGNKGCTVFLTIGYEKDYELVEQKPAWSEEDERIRQETIDWFEKKCFPYALESENPAKESIKWLKSLKDRVLPQPMQEWSKEDEDILNTIINHFKVDIECTDEDDVVRWLKSLRPQNTWKPSDEQMEAVRIAAEIGTANNSWAMCVLKSMYQGLKKLREESL